MKTNYFVVNVEAAIYRGDKWLIIKRSEKEENAPGTLSLVGGKVELPAADNREDIMEETLLREIDEEVGIKVVEASLQYLESKFFVSDTGEPVVDLVFLAEYQEGVACCHDEEVGAVYWMTAEEVLKNQKSPVYLKESIQKAVRQRSGWPIEGEDK